MFELKVSKKCLLSHIFLDELVNEHKLGEFSLTGDTLYSTQALPNSVPTESAFVGLSDENMQAKLLVFAEGLNFKHLQSALSGLEGYLTPVGYKVVQVEGVKGFAICVHVAVKQEQGIKLKIEQLAQQLCIELCFFEQVPSLSEPGLLLMDMDSTVIAVECIDEIAELAGVGEEVSAVTARAMQGQLDFAESLRTRVACLRDADESILQKVRDALPLMPGAANLVKLLKTYQWKVAIASGGFTYFANYLQDRLELDAAVANKLSIVDGKLTGEVEGGIVDAQVKAQTLTTLAKQWSISASQTVAMGDGANDLVMMDAAALGVGLHAKPVVREKADIAIRRGGLDVLLWVLAAS